jgi:antitoxin YefM
MKAVKTKAIVNKQGTIELLDMDISEGTEVEIIVLVPNSETDTTEYLLSTEANKKELLEAIERVKNPENMVIITPQQWHEKYSV